MATLRLTDTCPSRLSTGLCHRADTLRQLEKFFVRSAPSFSGSALAHLLHLYASHSRALGGEAAEVACERALAILQAGSLAVRQAAQQAQQGFTLGALARLLSALALLGLNQPRLLCALLHAAAAALRAQEQAANQAGGASCRGVQRDLAWLASALGKLQAAGQLAAAGLDQRSILPLWIQLCTRLDGAAATANGGLQHRDAEAVQLAAAQLDASLGSGQPTFFLPPAVVRAVTA